MRIDLRGCARAMYIPILTSATVKPVRPSRARRVPVVPVHARRARRAVASVAPAVPAVTAAPDAPVAPTPHTGIPTHREPGSTDVAILTGTPVAGTTQSNDRPWDRWRERINGHYGRVTCVWVP